MGINELVSSLGYPAGVSVVAVMAIKYVFDRYSKQTDIIVKVIENNTEAITAMKTQLETLLDREEKSNEKDS